MLDLFAYFPFSCITHVVNGHTMRCTSPVSVVMRLRLVSGWELLNGDQRRPMGPWGSGKDFFIHVVLL